jgi:hypothetical protein
MLVDSFRVVALGNYPAIIIGKVIGGIVYFQITGLVPTIRNTL